MQNYKVQIKISKENVPSLLQHYDELAVWNKVKEIVKDGNAELTVFERDDDYQGFEFPAEVNEINAEWDVNFKGNLFIETDFMLSDEETNKGFVLNKVYDLLEKSNLEIYSYYYSGDLYQSFGYIDTEFTFLDGEESTTESSENQEVKREQLDMFKKKRKSK